MPPPLSPSRRRLAPAALAVALHGVVLGGLAFLRPAALPRVADQVAVTLMLETPIPEPPPEQPPSETPMAQPEPPRAAPEPRPIPPAPVTRRAPAPRPSPRPEPTPPSHFDPATASGLETGLAPPTAGTASNGRAALGAFADAVRRRVQAAKTTPPGLEHMAHQCLVNFHVVIDPAGQLLSYTIDGCGNPFLDSAARAAVLKAGPFPRPPELGASRYDVYGNLVWREP